MKASIEVAMGGRAAEELIFGYDNVTSGASRWRNPLERQQVKKVTTGISWIKRVTSRSQQAKKQICGINRK